MKILLRHYEDEVYVWKQAKYYRNSFYVEGDPIDQTEIVTVLNDNRKNYVICSSCGTIFPINGKKFKKHQQESEGVKACMKCKKLGFNTCTSHVNTYTDNGDGTFTQKSVSKVQLVCTNGLWNHYDITSAKAIANCNKRRCGEAQPIPIRDIFTERPGVFDDIITVDKILENGYESIPYKDRHTTEYLISSEAEVHAVVNSIGIVDRFIIGSISDCGEVVCYSKKYNELYSAGGFVYSPYNGEYRDAALECIAKLYK